MILKRSLKEQFQPGLRLITKESGGMNNPSKEPLDSYRYDANADRTEILWKCLKCGELKPRNKWVLRDCPACGARKSQFVLVNED
jgi:rubrerythrin